MLHLKQVIILFYMNEQKVQNMQKFQCYLKSLGLPYEPLRFLNDRDNRDSYKLNSNINGAALCAERKKTTSEQYVYSKH